MTTDEPGHAYHPKGDIVARYIPRRERAQSGPGPVLRPIARPKSPKNPSMVGGRRRDTDVWDEDWVERKDGRMVISESTTRIKEESTPDPKDDDEGCELSTEQLKLLESLSRMPIHYTQHLSIHLPSPAPIRATLGMSLSQMGEGAAMVEDRGLFTDDLVGLLGPIMEEMQYQGQKARESQVHFEEEMLEARDRLQRFITAARYSSAVRSGLARLEVIHRRLTLVNTLLQRSHLRIDHCRELLEDASFPNVPGSPISEDPFS